MIFICSAFAEPLQQGTDLTLFETTFLLALGSLYDPR